MRERAVRGRRHEVLPRSHARRRRQGDRRAQGAPAPRKRGAVTPTEIGTKIVTARFGDDNARTLAGYEASGGFKVLRKALAMRPEDITNEVKESNLRGRG